MIFFTDTSTKIHLDPWIFYRFSKFRMFWTAMMTCYPYIINTPRSRRPNTPPIHPAPEGQNSVPVH